MRLAIRGFLVITFLLGVLVHVSWAQSENVLVSFDNNNGGWPISTLIYDPASAAFYGTAYIGGTNNDGTPQSGQHMIAYDPDGHVVEVAQLDAAKK